MKAGWEVKTLGEVCEIKPPKSEARAKLNPDDLVSFVPMEALGINQKYLQANHTKPLVDVAGSYTYFADGDVLLAKITPCFENGKLGIANNLSNGVGFGSSEYIVFRPNSTLSNEWLYYYISRQTFRNEGAERMTGAVGHKRVSKDFIENYPIPIPQIQEQHRIVAILDQAFEGITKARENAEQNLQNARALFESYLQSVFSVRPELVEGRGEGWVATTLGEVCDVVGGGTPSKANDNYFKGNIFWATVRDMKSELLEDTEFKITLDAVKNSSTNIIPKGNVVIATRVGLGKVCLLKNDTAINQDLRGIVPKKTNAVNVDFLFYWFKSNSKKIIDEGTGATVQGVKLPFIKSLPINLPIFSEQTEIAVNLIKLTKKTQRLEALYQRKIACLDELKKSLLQQAFAGEL